MPYARKKDVGHVAPSFESKHVTVNSLVIRPELRVSLRLGDFENLFANALDDKKPAKRRAARMERMQALGLFYFPLKHAKAEKAFEVASWMMLANNWEKDELMDDMDGFIADGIFWTDQWDGLIALADRLFIDFEVLVGRELSNTLLQKAFLNEKVSNEKPTYDGMMRVIKSTAKMAIEHGIEEEKAKAYQNRWLAWLETKI